MLLLLPNRFLSARPFGGPNGKRWMRKEKCGAGESQEKKKGGNSSEKKERDGLYLPFQHQRAIVGVLLIAHLQDVVLFAAPTRSLYLFLYQIPENFSCTCLIWSFLLPPLFFELSALFSSCWRGCRFGRSIRGAQLHWLHSCRR